MTPPVLFELDRFLDVNVGQDQARAAALLACAHAVDADDARLLLDVMGLTGGDN